MLRALYNYKATYPAAVTFSVGDEFIQIPETKPDKNWFFVTAANGKSGFVPKNYMEAVSARDDEKHRFISGILNKIDNNTDLTANDRKETLVNLDKVKSSLKQDSIDELDHPSDLVLRKNIGSRESLNSFRSSKKRQAPRPPKSGKEAATSSGQTATTSSGQTAPSSSSQPPHTSIPHQVAAADSFRATSPANRDSNMSHSNNVSNGSSGHVVTAVAGVNSSIMTTSACGSNSLTSAASSGSSSLTPAAGGSKSVGRTVLSTFSAPATSRLQEQSSDCESSRCSLSPRPLSSLGSSSDCRESSLPLDSDCGRPGSAKASSTEDRFSVNSLQIPANEQTSFSHQTSISSVSTDSAVTDLATSRNSETDLVTVTYQHPQECCRQQALEMVEGIQEQSSLSYTVSTDLLRSILTSLVLANKDLNVLVPSLINQLKEDLYANESEIMASGDFATLISLFDQLTQAKEDEQQRNWMLYEDEAKILSTLDSLHTTLRNAKTEISKSAISRWKYHYVQNLVEYFQMETRWSIRKVLIQVFSTLASIDKAVISLMLSSVLPLELIQDMYENNQEVERLRHCGVLLTIIFSRGETVPVHYVDHLGTKFVDFLLDNLENPIESDTDEILPDVFMGVVASFNLQFQDVSTNLVLQALSKVSSAKIFTEKLLLLLNREEDPAQLLGSRDVPNSIHKLVLDVFSNDECIAHFYTNDLMVLIDIIARQLCDLGPGTARYTYLEMAHLVLVRSGYEEHLHRLADLQLSLSRIQEEEGNGLDKLKAAEICTSFSCFQSSSTC